MTTDLHHAISEIRAESNGHGTRVINLRMRDKVKGGSVLLWAAAVLLLGLAAAQGYVSWRAQFGFADAVRHDVLASRLEAAGLDCAAVIFALLGLAHARMGHSAKIERMLNAACAAGSMTMNVLAANLGSPRSVAVYVLPPLLYIAGSDRLIAVAGSAAGVPQPSVWQNISGAVPYAARFVLAPVSTATGLRRWLLNVTPLPAKAAAPTVAFVTPPAGAARPRSQDSATGGGSKKAVLLGLYADHPDHGNRSKASAVATELAPLANLQPGTARSYIYAALDGTSP